jgi:hypothetical protein
MKNKTALRAIVVLTALFSQLYRADAGEIEPRSYGNAPVDVNFLIVGYVHSEGGLSMSDASPLKDPNLKMDTGLLAYARTLDMWGIPGKIDVILPVTDLSGTAMVGNEQRERKISGLNDPRLRVSALFYGAPVLTVQEFPSWQQKLLIGASIQVSVPLGQYDPDKLVNLGNNRWFVKPDIGISKAWGDLTLELSTGVMLYSDNSDYFGGKKLEQNPLSTSQAHLLYSFGKGMWGAIGGSYDYGGRSYTNGVRGDDQQSNSRIGVTFALPLNKLNSIKLYANTSVHTTRGNEYDLLGLAWQFRWGGGL